MTELYFHEDDYCQIELLPEAAREFCLQETAAITSFSEQHKAPGGYGWTDVYRRKDNNIPLSELNVTLLDLRQILGSIAPEADSVYTGYSSCREECKATVAFGESGEFGLFADFDDGQIIQHIWLSLYTRSEAAVEKTIKAFQALSTNHNLILVDWGWCAVLDLCDIDAISTYLRKRMQVFTQRISQYKRPPWWKFWER